MLPAPFPRLFPGGLAQTEQQEVQVSVELLDCFRRMNATLNEAQALTSERLQCPARTILDSLGQAASDYRQNLPEEDFSGQKAALSSPTCTPSSG